MNDPLKKTAYTSKYRLIHLLILSGIIRLLWLFLLTHGGFNPVTVQKPDSFLFAQLSKYMARMLQGQGQKLAHFIPPGSYYENAFLFRRLSLLNPILATLPSFFFDDEFPLLTVSFIANLLLPLPIYLLCKELFSIKVATIATLLVIFHPVLIHHSATGCGESSYFLSFAFFLYYFHKTIRQYHDEIIPSSPLKYPFLAGLFLGIGSMARPEATTLLFTGAIFTAFIVKKPSKERIKTASAMMLGGIVFTSPLAFAPLIFPKGFRHPPLIYEEKGKIYYPKRMSYSIDNLAKPGIRELFNQWGPFQGEKHGFSGFFQMLHKCSGTTDLANISVYLRMAIKCFIISTFIEPGWPIVSFTIIGALLSWTRKKQYSLFFILLGLLAILPVPFLVVLSNIYLHILIVSMLPTTAIGLNAIIKYKKGIFFLLLIPFFSLWFYQGLNQKYEYMRKGSLPNQKILKEWFNHYDDDGDMVCCNPWLARAANKRWVPSLPNYSEDEVMEILEEYNVSMVGIDHLYLNQWDELKPDWIKYDKFLKKFEKGEYFQHNGYELQLYIRKDANNNRR